MSIAFSAEPIPLCEDQHGDIRVGGSRVLLDLVVHAFDDGATPETIVQMYPTLKLADVYAAIAYYLRHRQEIQEYLDARGRRAEETRRTIQSQQSEMREIRQRLLQRRANVRNQSAGPAE
ncbi:MAG TPA: DUF433 domain-containing protein [Pirellulaceae bacterium]|nr:DUF433 domain-containing protein [Pirellulaceae bacterium]